MSNYLRVRGTEIESGVILRKGRSRRVLSRRDEMMQVVVYGGLLSHSINDLLNTGKITREDFVSSLEPARMALVNSGLNKRVAARYGVGEADRLRVIDRVHSTTTGIK